MTHEELKKQYQEDVKKYGKDAYTPWEYKSAVDGSWCDCSPNGPEWRIGVRYRRKEQPFEPEYFSGLNWREALPLVGKVVEFSNRAETWENPTKKQLKEIDVGCQFPFICEYGMNHNYVRTTPETHTHPTITIGGVKLPRPEHIEPFAGTHYFSVDNGNVVKRVWSACPYDMEKLMAGNVHRTESRAQEWADWWQKTVIDKLK
jgi:hypothetical protein